MQDNSTDLLEMGPQELEPLTDEMKAALEVGLAQIERGEILSQKEADDLLQRRYQEWLKTHKVARQA